MAGSLRRLTKIGAVIGVAAAAVVTVVSVSQASPTASPKIVGGTPANIEDFPFTVALTQPDGFQFCGGTLVAANKVVTAAHCTVGSSPADIVVVAGRTSLSGGGGETSEVSDIWVHPDYQDATIGSDVSVLTLSTNLSETPIAINTDGAAYGEGTNSTVLGWGLTSEGGGSTSDTLNQVDVPITSDATCQSAYQEYNSEAMVCAGLPEGGKDSCQGDSGGPLVIDGKLAGIVSWGQGCAEPNFPGVYTRVSTYAADIQAQVGS